MFRFRSEWLWSAAILGILLAVVLPRRDTPNQARGSFDTGYNGKLAFYRTVAGLRRPVTRSRISFDALPPGEHALFILGPARYPSPSEWWHILQWVSQGHAVVFAARAGDPAVEIGPLMEIRPTFLDESRERRNSFDDAFAAESTGVSIQFGEESAEWLSSGYVVADSLTTATLVSQGGRRQVVATFHGGGLLVVCSSDYIFTNYGIGQKDNVLLAGQIADLAGAGSIVFDETLNSGRGPQTLGILFDFPLRPLTLQIVLLLVLFGWAGSRRFGAPVPEVASTRRRMTAHAQALGQLYYQAGAGNQAVASCLDYFRHQAGTFLRPANGGQPNRRGEPNAPAPDLKGLLDRTEAAVRNEKLAPSEAASLIRELIAWRKKLGTRGEAGRGV